MPAGENHYDTLQVSRLACDAVVQAAFEVLREHALVGDASDAPTRLARLNAAHAVLSDPDRRAAYDARLGTP